MSDKRLVIAVLALMVILTVVLVGIVGAYILWPSNPPYPTEKKFMPTEAFDRSCSSSQDCVGSPVPYDGNNCCTGCGSEAVNRKAGDLREEWKGRNCAGYAPPANCPIYECARAGPSHSGIACTGNVCQFVYDNKSS